MSYLEDIKAFVDTLADTYLLYFVGRPRGGIAKKLKGTPFRKRYERELRDLNENLKDEYSRLLHEEEREIPHKDISKLFDRYLEKFESLQERYSEKANWVAQRKEERDKEKLKEEVA